MARVVCVSLQRKDFSIPWGFRLTGGKDLSRPLIIHKVAAGTIASQQLKPGDVVLALQGKSARSLTLHDALELIRTATLSLEITVHQSPKTLQTLIPMSVIQRTSKTPDIPESESNKNIFEKYTEKNIKTEDVNNVTKNFDSDNKNDDNKITSPESNYLDSSSRSSFQRERLPDIVPKDVLMCTQNNEVNLTQQYSEKSTQNESKDDSNYSGRQSSQISGAQGNGVSAAPGNGGPPMPPPMPPPMMAGQGGGPPPPPPLPPPGMPSAKLNAQILERGSRLGPPAAIQAAMGKDKKPFTYTPGGIDLSEIRSPRMQRRICRNAAAEGVSVPPTPPTPPTPQAGGIPRPPPMHPQLAVAVLPPPPPQSNKSDTPPTPSSIKIMSPMKNNINDGNKPPINVTNNINNNGNNNEARKPPSNVYIPQQQPVINNAGGVNYGNGNNKPLQVQQTGHIYVAPVNPKVETQGITSQLGSLYIPAVPSTPQTPQTPQSQSPASPLQVNLNQAAKPWLNSQNRQQPMSPQNVAPHVVQHVAARQQPQSPPAGVWSPPNTPSTRIIPIQVEGRESPVNAGPQQNTGARTRVVPIQVEGAAPSPPPQQQWQQQQQPRVQPVYTHNKFGPGQEQNNVPTSPSPPVQSRSFRVLQRITASDEDGQGGPQAAPVSHTGPPPPPPAQQFYQQQQQQHPKLQLSNDDRQLMDRFKAQDNVAQQEQDDGGLQLYRGASIPSRVFRLLDKSVDGEMFLHSEADPRYRGAAIPSRAFRMLQTMTEGGPMVPGMQGGGNMQNMLQQQQQQQQQQYQQQQQQYQQQQQQGRPEWSSPPPTMMQVRPDTMSPQQAYVPASEQGAQPEPRKYTGSCIPSRSFRMLQAMTAPEDLESTENSDVTSEAMYYAPPSPCPPSPYSWYYPTEGGSGDPVWDSYIYAYMSNYGHCPPGYYYPQHCNNYESDDYSGYSSTEEMAYYGQQRAPPPQNQPSPLAQSEVEESAESAVEEEQQDGGSASTSDDEAGEDGDEDDEDSDTEVEESEDEQKSNRLSGSGLQAIKSVHDIHASSGHEEEEEDDSECGSDVEDSEGAGRLGAKQLSVIYEESEHSDAESVRRMRWRASQTPALTETEEESSDADEPSQETKLNVSNKPLQNSNDKIYCDNKTRDKNLSDDQVSKVNVSNNFDKNSDESEESEEESEDNDENIECKKEVIKVEEDEEVSDEEECEQDKNSAGSDVVSEEDSEEESDDRDSSDKNEKPLKSVSADEDESCVSNETNTSTNEESSDDENERKSNKLKNSPTVVEIKKSTIENDESDSNSGGEEPEATVTVRLPLRLKFSRNSSEEAVTTLIVGDSEQVSRGATEPSAAAAKVEEWMQRGESETSCNTSEDPQVSVCLSLPLRRKPAPPVETTEAEDSHWEDDSSSTSIQTVRPRCASLADAMSVLPQNQESAITTDERLQSPSINDEQTEQQTLETTNIIEPQVTVKKSKSKDKTSQAAEKRAKRTIRRSSTEDDSGVTDLSRQMSDSESEVGAELLACQRAATHSRLFKLLQDACDGEEDEDEESQPRRELLHLPLRSDLRAEHDSSSLSSSGITSPASPTVAARLVRELAKELTRRKGKRQRPARLHAAAMRIMKEEDNDPYDTTTGSSASSDSGGARPSPLQPPNAAHTAVAAAPPMPAAYYPPYPPPPPPHVLAAYGPNYYEYLDYYNSWAAMDPRDYAVVPARAFRVLSNPGASPLDAPYAKCPRIICPNNSAPTPNKSQSPCHAQTPAS